jgi:hypothetical protein
MKTSPEDALFMAVCKAVTEVTLIVAPFDSTKVNRLSRLQNNTSSVGLEINGVVILFLFMFMGYQG